MPLKDFLHRYILERDIKPNTILQMQTTVRQFEEFAGPRPLGELSADDVNRFAAHLKTVVTRKGTLMVAKSIKSKLTNLKSLVNRAMELGEIASFGRVRHVKVPAQVVVAFTAEDVSKLLAAARRIPGYNSKTGIKRSDWWITFLMLAWDTAFRLGDLLELQFKNIRPNGVVAISQQKTSQVQTGRLCPETLAAVEELRQQGDRDRVYIFQWHTRREQFYKWFRKLCARAGVTGSSKYLRRSRATDECRRNGGVSGGGLAAAARVLGHSDATGQLALKNYIDRSQLDDLLPLPPRIGEPSPSGHPESDERPILDAAGKPRPLAFTSISSAVSVSTDSMSTEQRKASADRFHWETTIHGGRHDKHRWQYATRSEALAGHATAVSLAMMAAEEEAA